MYRLSVSPRAFLKLSIIVIALVQKGLSCPSLPTSPYHPISKMFWVVIQFQKCSAGKNTLEKMSKFNALVPEKISDYAPDLKVFIGLISAFFWF